MAKFDQLILERQTGHDRDILSFVEAKIRYRDKIIVRKILEKANHVFMWVVLVLELLNRAYDEGRVRAMKRKLDEVPPDLERLFSSLFSKEDSEMEKQETLLMFQWVLFAEGELTSVELYFAVIAGTRPEELGRWNQAEETNEVIRRFITTVSKGLVEIGPRYQYTGSEQYFPSVQFIHESVRDFLLRNKRLKSLAPSNSVDLVGYIQNRLTTCCLRYIMIKDHGRIENCIFHSKDHRVPHLAYPFLQYATQKLLYHAEQAEIRGGLQLCLLEIILQNTWVFRRLEHCLCMFGGGYYGRILQGYTPQAQIFHLACAYDWHGLAEILLKSTKINSAEMQTAFHFASQFRRLPIMQLLVRYGADVNARVLGYHTPLHTALLFEANNDVVKFLLDNGADMKALGRIFGDAVAEDDNQCDCGVCQFDF